jgi:tetratricopeptide (TPR) repeat protein
LNGLAALACALLLSSGSNGGEEHLVLGARHFRDGRYAEALVEFRVAAKMGIRQAPAYVGASLVNLERYDEAIEAFGASERAGSDALLDYYRALACHGARLYACAAEILAGVGDRSGPRLAEQAAKLRADVAAKLAVEPTPSVIEWYATRCAEHRRQGRAAIAAAYCAEAAALSKRRPAKSDAADARGGMHVAAGGRP